MNERVEELYKTLYESALVSAGRDKRFSATNLDVSVNFAELLVQECISQIAMVGISNFDNDKSGDIAWTVSKSIAMIKQHFGVEE